MLIRYGPLVYHPAVGAGFTDSKPIRFFADLDRRAAIDKEYLDEGSDNSKFKVLMLTNGKTKGG